MLRSVAGVAARRGTGARGCAVVAATQADLGAALFAALAVVVAVIFIATRLGPLRSGTGEQEGRLRLLRERIAGLEDEVRRLREEVAELRDAVRRGPPGGAGEAGITERGGPR